MMVNCLKCGSKIDNIEAWIATCKRCNNPIAFCQDCFHNKKIYMFDSELNCCYKDNYKMITLS